MNVYNSFQEMAAGTGALQPRTSQMNVFNADVPEEGSEPPYVKRLRAMYSSADKLLNDVDRMAGTPEHEAVQRVEMAIPA